MSEKLPKYIDQEIEKIRDELSRSILSAVDSSNTTLLDQLTPRAVYLVAKYIHELEEKQGEGK